MPLVDLLFSAQERNPDYVRLIAWGILTGLLTDDVFGAVGEPIRVSTHVPGGRTVPLTTFAAAVAVALSLMFVGVLLAAGSLALERTENTFERLVRSSLSRTGLVAEKIVLAKKAVATAKVA